MSPDRDFPLAAGQKGPDDDPALDAWRAFFEAGDPRPPVRPTVLALWRAYAGQDVAGEPLRRYDVAPPAPGFGRLLDAAARAAEERLAAAWRPFWLIADAAGRVLAVSPADHPLTRRPYGLRPGLKRGGSYPPTALDAALKRERAAWLVGAEHPHRLFHRWTSLAGPAVSGSEADFGAPGGAAFLELMLDRAAPVDRALDAWVTAHRALVRAAAPADRAAALARDVADRLRNPLATVMGYFAAHPEALSPPWQAPVAEALQAMQATLDRMTLVYAPEAPRPEALVLLPALERWRAERPDPEAVAVSGEGKRPAWVDRRQLLAALDLLTDAVRDASPDPLRITVTEEGRGLVIRLPAAPAGGAVREAVGALRRLVAACGGTSALVGEGGGLLRLSFPPPPDPDATRRAAFSRR